MIQRAEDNDGLRVDRIIPLWGIITLCFAIIVPIFGQAILTWQGQREAAIEQRNLSAKVEQLTEAIKSMDAQGRLKETKDVARDALIADHERRITRLETRSEVRP